MSFYLTIDQGNSSAKIALFSDFDIVDSRRVAVLTEQEIDALVGNRKVVAAIYSSVSEMPEWALVTAIQTGEYYEVPFGPYNWMGFPPSVQRYLGMMWMAQLLYPEEAQLDLYARVAEYYRLFYHCDLTEEQYHALVAHSIDAQQAAAAPAA